MNEELDSQLSAMFDDELPSGECELLARRLSRDEGLKARWSRYAVIGAVIRAERGVVLQSVVADRVNAALTKEPRFADAAQVPGLRGWVRLAAGAGLAAGVAAVSILWLRMEAPGARRGEMTVASTAAPAAATAATAAPRAPDSFVVPPVSRRRAPMMMIPPTQLADYVVAHSAYSWPISRGSLLSSLMVSDPGTLSPSAGQRVPPSHGHATHAAR